VTGGQAYGEKASDPLPAVQGREVVIAISGGVS
jgi:hypothetical protein